MLAYLDDINIYSWTWTEHLAHSRQVFERLQAAGLRVNPRKSKLGFKELEYLGYTVGQGRLKPQKKEVEAILSTAGPQTLETVPGPCGVL